MFGGVGCHATSKGTEYATSKGAEYATSKGAELSCELDYDISFWLWILLWKYPHFVEISTFRRYYPHFVEISTIYGYYLYFMYRSVFCVDYPHFVKYSRSMDIIRISSVLYLTFYSSSESDLWKIYARLVIFGNIGKLNSHSILDMITCPLGHFAVILFVVGRTLFMWSDTSMKFPLYPKSATA